MTQGEQQVSRWQFFGAILVCAGVLLAANATVARLTRHTVSKRILAEAAISSHAETIALGNSLVRAGFVAEEFSPPRLEGGRSTALNMAMGASSPAEHLLLLRAALRSNANAQMLLYGYYDFQLTDPVQFTFGDLIGNHDLLYFEEPEFARRFYSMSRMDSIAFEISRQIPLIAERGAVWAKVQGLRRTISQQGMPREAMNTFGRVSDFSLLEAHSREEFVEHCERAANAPLNAPVAEIIRQAHEKRMNVVFIAMPLPPRHLQLFYDTPDWRAYQQHVQNLLASENVRYLDASRWIPDPAKFADALHLSEAGAQEFSRRLGQTCTESSCETLKRR